MAEGPGPPRLCREGALCVLTPGLPVALEGGGSAAQLPAPPALPLSHCFPDSFVKLINTAKNNFRLALNRRQLWGSSCVPGGRVGTRSTRRPQRGARTEPWLQRLPQPRAPSEGSPGAGSWHGTSRGCPEQGSGAGLSSWLKPRSGAAGARAGHGPAKGAALRDAARGRGPRVGAGEGRWPQERVGGHSWAPSCAIWSRRLMNSHEYG